MFARSLVVTVLVAVIVGHGCARAPREHAPAPRGKAPAAKAGPTTELGSAPRVAQKLGVTFGKELELVGFNISPSPVVKGEPATLEIVWRCLAKPSRDWAIWTHLNYAGSPARRFHGDHWPSTPASKWQAGRYYVDGLMFKMPEDFKGGAYGVSIGLYAYPPRWNPTKPLVRLPETMAAGSQRSAEIGVAYSRSEEQPVMSPESRQPRVAERLSVAFGDELVLVGYSVDPTPIRKGDPATLEIVWKCLTRPSRDWTVWTHIGPSQMINRDHRPALPVLMWRPGKYYRDKVSFTIPRDKKPGQYPVSIGLYAIAPEGQPTVLLPEKVMEEGRRTGTMEVGFSAGR